MELDFVSIRIRLSYEPLRYQMLITLMNFHVEMQTFQEDEEQEMREREQRYIQREEKKFFWSKGTDFVISISFFTSPYILI